MFEFAESLNPACKQTPSMNHFTRVTESYMSLNSLSSRPSVHRCRCYSNMFASAEAQKRKSPLVRVMRSCGCMSPPRKLRERSDRKSPRNLTRRDAYDLCALLGPNTRCVIQGLPCQPVHVFFVYPSVYCLGNRRQTYSCHTSLEVDCPRVSLACSRAYLPCPCMPPHSPLLSPQPTRRQSSWPRDRRQSTIF